MPCVLFTAFDSYATQIVLVELQITLFSKQYSVFAFQVLNLYCN